VKLIRSVLVCTIALSAAVHAGESNVARQVTVMPEAADGVLINPGAGWQMITYIPPKDEIEKMPEISTFYTRYGWSSFETAPGKFGDTWETKLIDAWLEHCKKHNRYFGFRVVTYSPGAKEACVPEFVFQAGAKRFAEPGSTGAYAPAFWDKTFLDRHEKLVEWMGQRWGKHPNLAYIDIPGGAYGEWNLTATGNPKIDDINFWKSNGLSPDTWDAMVNRMVEMYFKNFPNRLVLSSGGIVEFGKVTTPDWAVSKKLGWRDDGLGMAYCTAGKKNEYFEKYWKKVPCLYENGYIDWTSFGDRSKVEPCINWAVDQSHASIITIGKNEGCLKAYTQYKDLVLGLGKKLGYHFNIQQASYYNRPTKGQPFNVALQISNTGNVPVYFDCKLEISFVDDAGQVLGQEYADVTPPVREWMPGAPIQAAVSIKVPGSLPSVPARLCLGIVNAVIPEQRLQLPLKITAGDRRYVLGPLTIQGAGYSGGAPATNAAPADTAAPPPPALDAKALEPWDARLVERSVQGVKDGQRPNAFVKVFGAKDERVKIIGADAKALTFELDGNTLPPIAWQKLDAHDRLSVASSFLKSDSAADHLLVAVFELANRRADGAADHLAKAQLCDPKPDAAQLAAVRAMMGAK
jgi:hypothetical protein